MALFLGLLDYLFDRELGGIISRSAIAIGVAAVVVVAGAVAAVIMGRQSAR
jgi:hypothetical protein